MSMCDALCRGCGWSQTTWFDPNRGWVLLQTTWFDPNRGSVWHQTTWFGPNRSRVWHQTTWFGPNRGWVLLQTTWFDPNRGWVLLQTIGLARIGVGFCFKPLVWPQSGAGFGSNHWFDPNRGRVLLQTIGLTPIGGRFGIKPPGLIQTKPLGRQSSLVFAIRSARASDQEALADGVHVVDNHLEAHGAVLKRGALLELAAVEVHDVF